MGSVKSKWSAKSTWPVLGTYGEAHLRKLAVPLGGIGTGTVSLGGRGDLRDWEIMNVPAKGFVPVGDGGSAQVAIRTLDEQGLPIARLLEGPIAEEDFLGAQGCEVPNHGLPRFSECRVEAAYPLTQIYFEDAAMPVDVRLEAFNPLVPGDVAASSLPLVMLRYVIRNRGAQTRPVTICATLPNTIGCDGSRRLAAWDGKAQAYGAKLNRNRVKDSDTLHGLVFETSGVDVYDAAWGDMALVVMGDGVITRRCHWAGGGWGRPLLDFWDDLLSDGQLEECEDRQEDAPMGSVAMTCQLAPGEETTLTVVLGWRFPNRRSWTPAAEPWVGAGVDPDIIGNHYATVFPDAWSAVTYFVQHQVELEARTLAFVTSIVDSDLPRPVTEAALSNLSTLRSQTCFRTPDGFLFGWEGTHDNRGSCYGSCTHVWNYEHATAQLFPGLARGMREIEFLHATDADGAMSFRVSLPLGRLSNGKAAADGQLGCLVKLWREWRASGDTVWLRRLWPQARKALEFCWISGGWDGDADGVMEGCQHNTMDVEYCGPNPQMQGWYLAALRAMAGMALALGEAEFADRCQRLFAHGQSFMDATLWNGAWYEQQVRIIDPVTIPPALVIGMGGADGTALQLAGGCLIDQLIGDACARLYGLGTLHDPQHIATTLMSIATVNRREGRSTSCNPMRSYALGDEPALVMAHYPADHRPAVPFPYFAEVMTGFEYTSAIGMVQNGLEELALRTVKDIRDRHDGRRRNPFDEPECGHHYVRAMASWGVLLAWTGQRYDAVTGVLHLGARLGTFPWCMADGFGTWTVTHEHVLLICLSGRLQLTGITIDGRALALPLVWSVEKHLRAGESLSAKR